jgi:hypothetical protein
MTSRKKTSPRDLIDILNEKVPPQRALIALPESYKASIVAEESKDRLYHADERIARRASTIASLALIIKERDVSLGLRKTLVTQADRLHRLAKTRFDDIKGEMPEDQIESELTGNEPDSKTEENE